MSSIRDYLVYRISKCKNCHGRPPELGKAFPAFAAAILLSENVLGIDTTTKAEAVTGVSRAAIDNASIILASGDLKLVRDVLSGFETLSHAAKTVRSRVKLINSFQQATPPDRAALGQAFGPEMVFDRVVVPDL